MPTTVSVVIINYNGSRSLPGCLESVESQSSLPNEIIVVDNASTDDSASLVKRYYPNIRLIESYENLGYAGGCNLGILESSGELVAILNNDLRLDRNWLRNLLSHVEQPWSFWASMIVFASNPGTVDSAGDAMAVVGSAYKIGHGDPYEQHSSTREVFGPCGAAALYRRELLEDIGLFDDDFFLVYEDADLNMRAQLFGYRCLFVSSAIVHHEVNQSIGRFTDTYVFYGHRNSEFLFWKNMPWTLLLIYLPERILFNILSFLFFSYHGRGGTFLRAKLDFLMKLPTTLRKRKKIQMNRRLTNGELRQKLDRNWFRYRRKVDKSK